MDTTIDASALARPVAVVETLNTFRDPWDFALLQECFFGVRRFDEFQKQLGISRNMLSKRLKSMVEQGVLERRLYQPKPDRYEYRLTDKGRDLFPIFMAIKRWGERWVSGKEQDQWHLEHRACERSCHPVTVCDQCGEEIAVRDIAVVPNAASKDAR